ncbi:hypothetical protein [Shewanella nanhaiensis]|uniref:Uncharacterized protein n=1 Tax=Shewanella nanhaiensis TaxID=2864872 RepID=A0ABS7E2F8_9GAMM|nr:hypothetical protein [Shewanella nanhaiensis]MBW8183840.1 hypothetical protein [Shewanella nanhaiensis]
MKTILGVIAGIFFGSLVNMALVTLGGELVQPPKGVDVTDMESLASSMHLFEPQHYLFPFLAHAFGTLVGAFVAGKIAATGFYRASLFIGLFFLLGGIASSVILPAPAWFITLDLVLAYIPMSWLGFWLSKKLTK